MSLVALPGGSWRAADLDPGGRRARRQAEGGGRARRTCARARGVRGVVGGADQWSGRP
ncbi:hypothetical protein SCE1572_35715 [Sorangium cellulosum So0157-2]|uniref:Uncharacterized protein n=1 Tax=Sorangium cellulosum So0157-2 TaxID=1254432 RepID=S4Y1K0_SORCE|nr:hypothetical protein SCE1572_35715 [Sorangium cellulosum So0157-2]